MEFNMSDQKKDSVPAESTAKPLSFFDLVAIGVGGSLAVGVFVLIGDLIKNIAGPAVVVSISLAGITAAIGGLCCAEFGVRLLKADSAYPYCYFWSTESTAFIYGWALIFEYLAGTASVAKGIITFIDALAEGKITTFLSSITSLDNQDIFPYFDIFSCGIVILIITLVAFGIKNSIIVQKVFTTANVILIASIIIAGVFKADLKNWDLEEATTSGFAPFGVLGIVKGAGMAIYGFIGFDSVSHTGTEIRKRKRNMILSIFSNALVIWLGFAGVGVVLTLMLPYNQHELHAAVPFAFEKVEWIALKWIVIVISFFGFQTSLLGAVLPLPRIIYAMANDGLLIHCLGNSYTKSKIPILACMTGGLLAAVMAGFISFQTLVNLTVLGTLFVYIILGINIVLLRYSPNIDGAEKHSESWIKLIDKNVGISVKSILKNYFNFKSKSPTVLTKFIITGNIILFCLSSIGISVIFIFFYDSVIDCAAQAVIPMCILLGVMCLNIISTLCQPKSQKHEYFKVPFVPFIPCLSIFLNIFLMVTFEWLTWVLFLSWMALGITAYSAWRCLKSCKGEIGENSLFEINRTNAIKLNESIMKIKNDKKSFYDWAENPAFSDNLDDTEVNMKTEEQINNKVLPKSLQQADIIQTAEVIMKEKAEPLETKDMLNLIHITNTGNEISENDKVEWECVAEIHTEEEFSPESIALEIVDNTYNFLSGVSEELLNNENLSQKSSELPEVKELSKRLANSQQQSLLVKSDDGSLKSDNSVKSESISFKDELLKVHSKMLKKSERFEDSNVPQNQQDLEIIPKKPLENGYSVNSLPPNESHDSNLAEEEQNPVKTFKEKLNQLLKNQLNNAEVKLPNNTNLYSPNDDPSEDTDVDVNEENKNSKYSKIKTLNKSEIRGKLEFLLAKGPPRRPSLRSSFKIDIKKNETDNKTSAELPSIQNNSATVQEGLISTNNIVSLENLNTEVTKDVCC